MFKIKKTNFVFNKAIYWIIIFFGFYLIGISSFGFGEWAKYGVKPLVNFSKLIIEDINNRNFIGLVLLNLIIPLWGAILSGILMMVSGIFFIIATYFKGDLFKNSRDQEIIKHSFFSIYLLVSV